MTRFLMCAVVALAAVCSADDVGQDRVGVLGRRLKGSFGHGGGLDGAGFRGASDGHQGFRGLGAGGHQIGEAGHGNRATVLGDGVRGVHGGRVGSVDLRSKIAGLKGLSGRRGPIGGLHSGGWAGQGTSHGLGKAGANVGLNAENHGLGLGQVIANIRHGKGARVPRDVVPQDNIQGGVGKILAGALAGKDGVPQIVQTSLGLGHALGKSIGFGNIQGSAPVGAGAGSGPFGGWANNAGHQSGILGTHGGAISGPGIWNNGRGHIAGSGLVNLAPSGPDGSWDNHNGQVKVNPEGVLYIEDDGGPVVRGNLEWKDIGNGNFQWVQIGQNQVTEQTPAGDEFQGGSENQESGQTKGADENQGAAQNQKSDQNQGGDETQGVGQNNNSGQNSGNADRKL